jgi:hypothetical protein
MPSRVFCVEFFYSDYEHSAVRRGGYLKRAVLKMWIPRRESPGVILAS